MNKQLLLCGVLAILFLSCSGSKEAGTDGELKGPPKPITSVFKMLSINLAHGLQDKSDVKKFSDWVKTTGAEVVAVQQIERATESKPGFDAYEELLKKLDMRGTFAKARYFKGWDSGNALFCMYPMMQSNVYALPVGKGKVRRSLSFAVFELGLKSVAFASTDLDDEDLSERLKQVREIFSIQKSMEEYPIVVAGNFGESVKGKASATMMEKYSSTNAITDQLSSAEQHVFVPLEKKMNVIAAEKVVYKPLNQTGVLVTVEVVQ
ncbi:MAG: hypothetical protein AB1728_02860 [Bacteroidota bacterium]